MILLAVLGGAGAVAAGGGGAHSIPAMPVARPIVAPMPVMHPAGPETQRIDPIRSEPLHVVTPFAKIGPTVPPRLPPYYPFYPYVNPYLGWADQYRFVNQLQTCQQQPYFGEYLYLQPTLLCQPYGFESFWSDSWLP
jgi:hypothetical protein